MTTQTTCPRCGGTVAGDGPAGNCPSCLWQLALHLGAENERSVSVPELGSESECAPVRYFGEYELFGEIARGGMGVVYRARQLSLNRLVGLKMMQAAHLATPALVQRFQLEAEAAARLEHPNIVPIYDIGEHDGQHYFTMKLMPGGTLADLRRKTKTLKKTSIKQIAELVSKVARAVHYAHQHGILHRDLKPTNILLDEPGEPHVTDFGLAKFAGGEFSQTLTAEIIGTPSYMSPEQASGQKGLTTAADIYCLGAILFDLLTGGPPFQAETTFETLRRVREDEPPRLSSFDSDIDRDLQTICLKCLNKDPARRYSSAAMLADDLDRWLSGEAIHARPVRLAEKVWSWCRRKPAMAVSLGTIGVLLVIDVIASPIVIDQINRARVQAENARRDESALRQRAETREKLVRAQLLCDDKFDEAAILVNSISGEALQDENENAAIVFTTLTDSFARHGRWKEALGYAIKAVECKPQDHMNYVSLLVLLAATKDFKNYDLHRAAFLNRFANVENPAVGERIAKACLIFPAVGKELEVSDRLAQDSLAMAMERKKRLEDSALQPRPDQGENVDSAVLYLSYFQFSKGLADYRQGRFASAAELMRQSINDPFYGQGRTRTDHLLVAVPIRAWRRPC